MPRLYIEVNTGEEPKRQEFTRMKPRLFTYCQSSGSKIDGLMCIPPQDLDPAPFFDLLARLGARLGLEHLSMGMSADFDLAIAHGATEVRVGTAIFGRHRRRKEDAQASFPSLLSVSMMKEQLICWG